MNTFLKVFSPSRCILLVGLLILVFSLHRWFGPDIWHHLERGRAVLTTMEANPPFKSLVSQPAPAAPAWLFQLLVYSVFWMGSILLVSLMFAGIWILIAYNWVRLTGPKYNVVTLFLFLVFAVCIQQRMEHRPEVFSYLMMLLCMRLISVEGARQRLAFAGLFAIQVIWASVHGYFIFGIGIALAKFAAVVIENRENKKAEIQKYGLLTLGLTAASFIHPNGPQVWTMVYNYADLLYAVSNEIEEFLPTYKFAVSWPLTFYWPLMGVCLTAALYSVFKRKNIFATCLVFGGSMVGIESYRNQGIFLILAAPMAGVLAQWGWSYISELKNKVLIQTAITMLWL